MTDGLRAGAGGRPVGVIGGLGPLATACFIERVVAVTDAVRDQDHVELVVLHRPSVPDRTAFLLGRSAEDPRPPLVAAARTLEGLGVAAVVIPCNTADAFLPEITAEVDVPVVSIVERTVAAAAAVAGDGGTVGVLATDGTLAAGLYSRALAGAGMTVAVPAPQDQATVMSVIYDEVKAGLRAGPDRLAAVARRLRDAGAGAVVLGCTELSVVAADHRMLDDPAWSDLALVDSVDSLARATVVVAGRAVAR